MLLLQAAGGNGGMQMILMLVAMFAIIYFFMIRPQRKRQKEIENFRNSLQIGDKIVTASGVHGTIKDLNLGESYMSIEIAKGVVIKIDRNYVYASSNQAAGQGSAETN